MSEHGLTDEPGRIVKLTGPRSVADPRPARETNDHAPNPGEAIHSAMERQWHAASDHAKDGTPLGGPLCNCERVVMRARRLGWGPTVAGQPAEERGKRHD